MSDHWIALIPENPGFVPDLISQQRARQRFAEIAPQADDITLIVSEKVAFFDAGTNFERIYCPSCGVEVPLAWWKARMDEDYCGDGFNLARYATPCCTASCTVHELVYDWPQ